MPDINAIDLFSIPAAEEVADIKVKGSKFIATVLHVCDKEQAEEKYLEIKKKYYNATHNCFAYKIDENVHRYSDDGEPSGTAGKPILQALEGKDLNQVLCVVTRYYGGTKLGTGGLIRAYSEAANSAINSLQIRKLMHTDQFILNFSYELENLVRILLSDVNGTILKSDYSDKIKMEIAVPRSKADFFSGLLQEKTNTLVTIKRI